MMDDLISKEVCGYCGNVGLSDGGNGFFFCEICGVEAADIVDAAIVDEDFVAHGSRPALYSARHSRRLPPVVHPPSLCNTISPDNVRFCYVSGLQMMIIHQCHFLIHQFNVHPLICGVSVSIWLRFLMSTRVFDDDWANQVSLKGCCKKMYTAKTGNDCTDRKVLLWYKALRKTIPLQCSLAITYLSCHVSRQFVLPTDIHKATLEGKLPYLNAFVEIQKTMKDSRDCAISADVMFRPIQAITPKELESLAALIAESVGLTLPPVNFDLVGSRYLNQLSLPVDKVLPFARRIRDWSMPSGLWLSTCDSSPSTQVCVMAVLIVSIRILYNLNGFGIWEASLLNSMGSASTNAQDSGEEANCLAQVHKFEPQASSLLHVLLNTCNADISDKPDYTKDLESYLRYCNDVVFSGSKPPSEYYLEDKMINRIWEEYVSREKACLEQEELEGGTKRGRVECSGSSRFATSDELSDSGVRMMKQHMKENGFWYIPPRKRIKRLDYLQYVRKRDYGSFTYAMHADYYILLYACAREAQVDIGSMHRAVLSLETRLAQIEEKM